MTEEKEEGRASLWANVEPTTPRPKGVEVPDDWMPDPEDIKQTIRDVLQRYPREQGVPASIRNKVIR